MSIRTQSISFLPLLVSSNVQATSVNTTLKTSLIPLLLCSLKLELLQHLLTIASQVDMKHLHKLSLLVPKLNQQDLVNEP